MHVENLVTNIKICMINKDFPFELTIVPTTFIRNLNMNKITYFFVISSRGESSRRGREREINTCSLLLFCLRKYQEHIKKHSEGSCHIMITVVFGESDQCQILVGSLVQLWVTYFLELHIRIPRISWSVVNFSLVTHFCICE